MCGQKGESGKYISADRGIFGGNVCWRLDRGLLVKKLRRGNIWGRGEGARWTAGRDALARAQKAGGRPEGNTPVSKVLPQESARKGS